MKKRQNISIFPLLIMGVFLVFASSCEKDETPSKKDPIITWANPADIGFGTLLSATQLNATADIVGTFVYTPAIGTKLNEGANQDLKVVFTPTDTETYNVASKTVKINVTTAGGNSAIDINWLQKADFGGGKIYDAASFVIGNYAYVATGSNNPSYGNGLQRFMYRYDPSLDVWKRMADLPPAGAATFQAVGFAIGEKGYVCGGVTNASLWEYDPATNLWYQRINFPRVIEEGIGFAISSKAYIGLGGANSIDYKNDFYEYDPSKNKWTQLNDFPGAPRRGSIGFSMDGKGYAGLGYKDIGSNNKSYFKDLWEYDPYTDDWIRLPDIPGEARQDAIGFGIDGAIYVGMGRINDFYKYDLKTKVWSTLSYIPGNYRVHAFSFCIGSNIYYGGGMSPNLASDMWEYATLVTDVKEINSQELSVFPNPTLDIFHVDGIEDKALLNIYDLNGHLLVAKEITSNEAISVNFLQQGVTLIIQLLNSCLF